MQNKVIVIDYGSQFTQLIARRIRELGVYSEVYPCTVSEDVLASLQPSAIILSGGPASVGVSDAPHLDDIIFSFNVPILGICYGMQLIAQRFGGVLEYSQTREYGPAEFILEGDSILWDGISHKPFSRVWMSHGDTVEVPPPNFTVIGRTNTLNVGAIVNEEKKIYAVQFHPEVSHSEDGEQIIRNFLFKVVGLAPDWTMSSFIEKIITQAQQAIGDGNVVCALSGGVDSTVVALILHQAIGKRLHCIFVDNGLLRDGEKNEVISYLREHFDLNLIFVQAQDRFLKQLEGIEDPEEKRKIIGHTFIDVFDEEARVIGKVDFLAQGTLYSDIIESIPHRGSSVVIKSHHNVGGLPEKMSLKLIEPLKELFKDEVRKVAVELGLPDSIIWRHPFPGPGLAIRIIGEVTQERLAILRKADKIVEEELKNFGWYKKIWQGFAILLPLKTVGVMGDGRTYENVIALRCVDSKDAMTADWVRLPPQLLETISKRIINEVKGINRVVYDISSKPPSTIEWE